MKTWRDALYELLTGEPADPEAVVKAAITFAKKQHAERLSLIQQRVRLKAREAAGVQS